MHATLHNFSPPHTFRDTPGASTSAAAARFNSAYINNNQPISPSSVLHKHAYIDPQLRSAPPNDPYLLLDDDSPSFPNLVPPNHMTGTDYSRHSPRSDPDIAAVQNQAYNALAHASMQQMLNSNNNYPFYPVALHPPPTTPPGSRKRSPRLHPHALASQPYLNPVRRDGRRSPKPESFYAPNAALLYSHAQVIPSAPPPGATALGSTTLPFASSPAVGVPCRLPPILQVEKQQVTTTATQVASASRRRNEAHFVCPVPGCGSTFTRRFNLRGAGDLHRFSSLLSLALL